MPPRIFVAMMLAAMVVASGCLVGGGEPEGTDNVISPTGPATDGPSDPNRGIVEGYVVDQADIPLFEAHVTLEGTPYFSLTDRNGHYLLYNVEPGTYRLTASLANFTPQSETAVEVAESLVTRANVTMVSSAEPGRRPHRHDWWGPDTEVVIMDRDITFGASPVCITTTVLFGCTVPLAAGSPFTFESDPDPTKRPNLVYQGTGKVRMETTVDMTGAVDILVHTPTMEAGTYETLMTMKAGTTTAELELKGPDDEYANGDWDSSHSRASFWRFRLSPDTAPAVIQGPIHVKVTVIRGDFSIPVEKAHPDYWGNAANLTIMDRGCTWIYVVAEGLYETAHPECAAGPGPPVGNSVLVGTSIMRVTLTWNNELLVPTKFGLKYRPANAASFHEVEEPTKETIDPGGQSMRIFEFPVLPEECDSPYAGTRANPSKWIFNVFVTEPIPPNPATGDQSTIFLGEVHFKVDIWKEGVTPPPL